MIAVHNGRMLEVMLFFESPEALRHFFPGGFDASGNCLEVGTADTAANRGSMRGTAFVRRVEIHRPADE
jgi:hypothetical protein